MCADGDVLQSTLREINGSVRGTLPTALQKEGTAYSHTSDGEFRLSLQS